MTNSKNEILTSINHEGLGKQPWWVEQWMELINSYKYKKRLERAWTYAREGKVLSILFEGRRVHARVQGTDNEPYKVKLWLDVLIEEDWKFVLEALAEKASWTAQLLAGIMPSDIERAFAASGKRLFPFKLEEIKSECSCPDKANPCKHISAIYFLMGERFKEDPFVLFQLRGCGRETLLKDLAEKRKEILLELKSKQQIQSKQNIKSPPRKMTKNNPSSFWTYESNLHQDLVVIAPSIDEDTGIESAGNIPLAEEPLYPNAQKQFISELKNHCQQSAHRAMIKAMSKDN